jgi:NAD-dependent deacetylase
MVLATAEAFAQNPKLVWDWYEWRREVRRNVQPNAGHYALARMQELFPSFVVVTQNIDGLHRLAGSWDVIELHGNLQRNKCSRENVVIERASARRWTSRLPKLRRVDSSRCRLVWRVAAARGA